MDSGRSTGEIGSSPPADVQSPMHVSPYSMYHRLL